MFCLYEIAGVGFKCYLIVPCLICRAEGDKRGQKSGDKPAEEKWGECGLLSKKDTVIL